MIELFMIGFIALTGGVYIGQHAKKPAQPEQHITPDRWAPGSHLEMMRMCSITCGEGKVKSYSTVYGKCDCNE